MNYAEKAVQARLDNATNAQGRVTFLVASQNSQTPYLIVQGTASERWRSLSGPDGIAQAHVQVDTYGSDFYECRDAAAQAEALLDGFSGVSGGVTVYGITLQSEHDNLDQTDEPRLFRNIATYLVTYQQ